MVIVLDTNVLLVSISSRSKYHWIYKKYLEGIYTLCVSNEILMEYEEVLTRMMGHNTAISVIETIINSANTFHTDIYFRWNLIETDIDDNKFVDCALAGNAKYIVSEDRHFSVLKQITFPRIETLTIEEFHVQLNLK